ncbi:MAG: aminoglycoside phosphotransferase family protein [Marmoricola sp.]
MPIHDEEFLSGADVARRLIASQRPDLAGLPLQPVGAGTDNTMYRVGSDLLVRLPRTPGTEAALRKELRWLPRLGPLLSWRVPEPVFVGEPSEEFPATWALYRWIEGEPASLENVADWPAYGGDLASFVTELHALDLGGAARSGDLAGYRGGLLHRHAAAVAKCLEDLRGLTTAVDVDALERIWEAALTLPPPSTGHVWLHGDLKPTNVLVQAGRGVAIIDFGGLSIGCPDAEHAPMWDLPAPARSAYREALELDEQTWLRARAWALMIGASGVSYYWESYPEFAEDCLRRLQNIENDDSRAPPDLQSSHSPAAAGAGHSAPSMTRTTERNLPC